MDIEPLAGQALQSLASESRRRQSKGLLAPSS
jgi:hypothetical protein